MMNPTPFQSMNKHKLGLLQTSEQPPMASEKNLKIPNLFELSAAPPHTLIESKSCYSIVFNMLGISRQGIGIDLDVEKREITVLARKDRENIKGGFYWIFGVPTDALMSEMTARYKGGALEIVFPKHSFAKSSKPYAALAMGA